MEQNVTRLVDAIDDSYNQRETTYAPDVKPTKKRKTGKPVSKASEARGEST